jgi:hypothetical protein
MDIESSPRVSPNDDRITVVIGNDVLVMSPLDHYSHYFLAVRSDRPAPYVLFDSRDGSTRYFRSIFQATRWIERRS